MDDSTSPDEKIKALCLHLLTVREHSQRELLHKLALKGFTADRVQPVLNELALQDWQSDRRYAISYARQRIDKGYGALRVSQELRQRGITEFDCDSIVQDVASSWLALLEQTYRKKYTHAPSISCTEWAKRSRYLLQRGFSAEMINTFFKHLQLKFE
jgi:regulatory protein